MEKELEKLNQMVHKNPQIYVKLMELLERGDSKWVMKEGGKKNESRFEFIYPPRRPGIASMTQILEWKFKKEFPDLSLKEHIHNTEKNMMEKCITHLKVSPKNYECINPDSEKQKVKTENWNKYMKEYYHNHSDSILEYKKQQYQKKKDVLNEKNECDCGKIYTRQHQKRHEKTKKHQDWENKE
jgi:ubiquitin